MRLNRVHHGDAIQRLREIPDSSIDICISDIPYGISYDDWDILHNNKNSALGGTHSSMDNTTFKRRGKPINGWSKADKKIPYEYQKWCEEWMGELFRITKEGSPIILFSSRRYLHRVSVALEDQGFLIRDVLIWKKDRAIGRAQRVNNILQKRGITDSSYDNYRIGNLKPQYEPIVWAMKPYKHTLTDCVLENKIGGIYCEGDILPSNILEFSTNTKNKLHPTQKPVELMRYLVKLFSISSEHVILDPFMGSGTTAIAALSMDRNFIGIEVSKDYTDVANNRIKEYLESRGLSEDNM